MTAVRFVLLCDYIEFYKYYGVHYSTAQQYSDPYYTAAVAAAQQQYAAAAAAAVSVNPHDMGYYDEISRYYYQCIHNAWREK